MASLPLIGLRWVQPWCQDQECPRGPRTFVLKSSPIPAIQTGAAWLRTASRAQWHGPEESRLTPAARKPVDRLQPITSDRNGASSSRSVRLPSRREWALALIPVLLPNDAILYHGCCTGAKIPSYLDTRQRPSQPIRVIRLTSLAPSHLRNPRASSPFSFALPGWKPLLISRREKGSPYPWSWVGGSACETRCVGLVAQHSTWCLVPMNRTSGGDRGRRFSRDRPVNQRKN